MGLVDGSPGKPGFRVAGFPVMSFRVIKSYPEGTPNTYMDLGISSACEYEWVSRLIADKLDFFRQTRGKTQQEAELKLIKYARELHRLNKS